MAKFWDEASFLLRILVSKVRLYDDGGLNLEFTLRDRAVTGGKMMTRFSWEKDVARAMDQATPETDAPMPATTNMPDALNKFFNQYVQGLEKGGGIGKLKRFTLIVLTDGKWTREGQQLFDVRGKILEFMTHCSETWPQDAVGREPNSQRPVSIQFIQFGDDEEARLRLRYLDNSLPFEDDFRDIG